MAAPNANTCAACGVSGELHRHHLVPKAAGGRDLPTVMLCAGCHGTVHGREFNPNHAELTRQGLAAAKARGVKLGNPRLKPGTAAYAHLATEAKQRAARIRASDLAPYIDQARKAGCRTLAEVAEALTNRGIKTPGGCPTWSAEQVRRVIKRTA